MSARVGYDGLTKAQRLRQKATEAAEVRDALTDPDVVALQVKRYRDVGEGLLWSAVGILVIFTMITVHGFVSQHDEPYSLAWFGAWFLEPGLVLGLIAILLWEGVTTRWQIDTPPLTRGCKWALLAATYVMNTWMSWAAEAWAMVVAHSVPPLVIVALTEARAQMLPLLTEAIYRAHAYATTRAQRKAHHGEHHDTATEPSPAPAAPTPAPEPVRPVGPPVAPAFRAVPAWSAVASANRTTLLGEQDTRPSTELVQAGAGDRSAGHAPARSAHGPSGSVRTESPDRSAEPPADRSGYPSPERSGTSSPDRSAELSADRVGGRSGRAARTDRPDRSGSSSRSGRASPPGVSRSRSAGRRRKSRAGRRTDAELLAEVQALAEANGGRPPTQYRIKEALGVGAERAARLLTALATSGGPAVPPDSNGATRREGDPR